MATLYKRLIVCSKICFGLKREHSHRSKHTTHLNDKRIWFICNTASHTVHTRHIYPPYSSPTHTKPIRVCVRSACLPSMLKSQCVTEATLCQTRFSASPYWLAGIRDHQGGPPQISGTRLMKTVRRGGGRGVLGSSPHSHPLKGRVPHSGPVLAQTRIGPINSSHERHHFIMLLNSLFIGV